MRLQQQHLDGSRGYQIAPAWRESSRKYHELERSTARCKEPVIIRAQTEHGRDGKGNEAFCDCGMTRSDGYMACKMV